MSLAKSDKRITYMIGVLGPIIIEKENNNCNMLCWRDRQLVHIWKVELRKHARHMASWTTIRYRFYETLNWKILTEFLIQNHETWKKKQQKHWLPKSGWEESRTFLAARPLLKFKICTKSTMILKPIPQTHEPKFSVVACWILAQLL